VSSSQPPADAATAVNDRRWRWRHSAWTLAPILGIGVFSFVGFVYCAIRVREQKWIVLACVSTALTVIGWILVSAWTEPNGDASNAATAYVIGLWLVSIVFAFVVNKDFLTWRASVGSRTVTGPVRPPAPVSAPTSPVAGWYTDPGQASLVRYWDGGAWTEHTAPRPR
jgi:hypothetical protein